MPVRRVVPDIPTDDMAASRDFYGLIGLREAMNQGWVMTLVSTTNPTAQVTFTTRDASAAVRPDLSVEVDDVDAVHAALVAAGAEIVHPLQNEEWGVRRFFVRDPNGKVVNVLSHLPAG
ncbi:VOC family protein [Streptomyces sp. NBC_01387]|uniref:VOC family protein n=1 Tax=unclassified Streptomyces TaxID=2593676 RepID=UPI002024BFDC|nr:MULTISPECIES: VOC family protein [unclassified Streptomyces]MCX4554086.1 VOC family protein [Streptomyces sp. NBC_01500]WSC18997.1 VOC family protein [Streptomyces sp. NBC_01766]WSV53020.1 VOC family protein [Streptomyces sp. NBC_01014]